MRGKVIFPQLSSEDWRNLREEADPVEREIIETQQMLAGLAAPLHGLEATAERVAWLALWSRLWDISLGLRGVLFRPSVIGHNALSRSWTELRLHFSAILEALLRGTAIAKAPQEEELVNAREALCAYLAWAIDSDLKTLRQTLQPKNLEGAYDPERARAFLRQLGDNATSWQAVLGEIEELSDQEAELDRQKGEASQRGRIERLARWLREPALRPWTERLKTRDYWSLSELLFDEKRSIRQQMRAVNSEFGYSLFQSESQVMHGSSFENLVATQRDGYAPRRLGDDLEEQICDFTKSTRIAFLPLSYLTKAIVPATDTGI